jgi:FtsH-binding integral membrane protein
LILNDKKNFLIIVFINLIFQLVITYYFFDKIDANHLNKIYLYLFLFILFLLIILLAMPFPTYLKFILFCIFSALTGYVLSGIKTENNESIIKTSIIGTLAIFIGMLLIGVLLVFFGVYLTNTFGFYLFIALLFIIIIRIITLFSDYVQNILFLVYSSSTIYKEQRSKPI